MPRESSIYLRSDSILFHVRYVLDTGGVGRNNITKVRETIVEQYVGIWKQQVLHEKCLG